MNHLFNGKIVVFSTSLGMEGFLAQLSAGERADSLQVSEEMFTAMDRYLPERLIAAIDPELFHVWMPMTEIMRRQVTLQFWNAAARKFFGNINRPLRLSTHTAQILARPQRGAPLQFGAAGMRGTIERLVFNPLIENILFGELPQNAAEGIVELSDHGVLSVRYA